MVTIEYDDARGAPKGGRFVRVVLKASRRSG